MCVPVPKWVGKVGNNFSVIFIMCYNDRKPLVKCWHYGYCLPKIPCLKASNNHNKMGVVKYICVNAFGTTTAATPFLKKKKTRKKYYSNNGGMRNDLGFPTKKSRLAVAFFFFLSCKIPLLDSSGM